MQLKRLYIIGFPLLMAFDTLAQFGFKRAGANALPMQLHADWMWRVVTQPWAWIAIAGYLGSFLTWMRLMREAPVGPAFAASHLEVISVMLLSAWFLHEHIGGMQLLGALVILAGVGMLAVSEARETSEDATG